MKLRLVAFVLFGALGALSLGALVAFVAWETRPKVVASMLDVMSDTAKELAQGFNTDRRQWSIDATQSQIDNGPSKSDTESSAPRIEIDYLSESNLADLQNTGILLQKSKLKSIRWSSLDPRAIVLVEDGRFVVAYPVGAKEAISGYIALSRPLSIPKRLIWASRWKILSVGIVIGAFAMGAGWWLSRRLTRALERLTRHARRIRDGEDSGFGPSRSFEIQTLAESLEGMRQALEGKQYIESYIQSLTHALKAPLSGMRASTEILADDPHEKDRLRFLRHLADEAKRMDRIVDRLLSLAALESGKRRMDREPLDLGSLAKERAEAFTWAKDARGVSIELKARGEAWIDGDRFWLGEAISEMLSNAVEFSSDGGCVTIEILRDGNRLICEVSDDGPGVPTWALSRVGERFYSLPRERDGRKGTGLGLSLIGEVARLHGGRFQLSNRESGGALARLEL